MRSVFPFSKENLISTFQSGANRVATYTENEFPYNYALACMDESRCFLFFSASDSLKSYSFCWGLLLRPRFVQFAMEAKHPVALYINKHTKHSLGVMAGGQTFLL